MTFLIALLPQPLGYGSVEGRVHNPNWHSRSKLSQMFTEFSLDVHWTVYGTSPFGFSAYPAWSQKIQLGY